MPNDTHVAKARPPEISLGSKLPMYIISGTSRRIDMAEKWNLRRRENLSTAPVALLPMSLISGITETRTEKLKVWPRNLFSSNHPPPPSPVFRWRRDPRPRQRKRSCADTPGSGS